MAASPTAVPVQGAAGLAVRDVATGAGHRPARSRRPVSDRRRRRPPLRVQSSTDGGASWIVDAGLGTGPLVLPGRAELRLYLPDGTSRGYQGTIAGVRSGDTTLLTVNTVGIDAYVAGSAAAGDAGVLAGGGVAGAGGRGPDLRGLRAGQPPGSASYDLCDTTQCQVYGGRRLYSGGTVTDLQPASVLHAVAQTPRQIRTYAGAPIFAQFSASNGGWTVADERFAYLPAQGRPVRPDQQPVRDLDGIAERRPARCSASRLPARVQRISVLSRDGHGDWGGRLVSVG